jgi:hypothetical protein
VESCLKTGLLKTEFRITERLFLVKRPLANNAKNKKNEPVAKAGYFCSSAFFTFSSILQKSIWLPLKNLLK